MRKTENVLAHQFYLLCAKQIPVLRKEKENAVDVRRFRLCFAGRSML